MTTSYIGATLSVSADAPASEDATGYGALSWTEVGRVISIGEFGDQSQDISFDVLKIGRTVHASGPKDIGEVPVVIEYDGADAGQTLVKDNNNTNTSLSFQITDPDGASIYFFGLVANLRYNERTANNYKGQSFVIRGQSALVETTP